MIGSLSGVGLVLAFVALLVAYIKRTEEQQLSARFGEEHLLNKRATPFLIPRPWRNPRPTGLPE